GTQVGEIWEYNVYEPGITCGTGDVVGPVSYKDRANVDLHLLAGSTAIDHGSPTNYPSVDFDGQARPYGPRADAGADEVTGSAPPPPPPPPSDTQAPSTPTGLATTGATQTSISVSWNASSDNV